MKKLLIPVVALLMASCAEKPQEAVIVGQVTNASKDFVLLTKGGIVDTIKLDADSRFAVNVPLAKPALMSLQAHRKSGFFYVAPGDSIKAVITDPADRGVITFEGSKHKINAYLPEVNRIISGVYGNAKSIFTAEKEQFLAKMDSVKKAALGLMDSMQINNPEVRALESKRIDYAILDYTSQYPQMNKYFKGEEYVFNAQDFDFMTTFNPNAGEDLMFQPYVSVVRSYISNKMNESVSPEVYSELKDEERIAKVFAIIDANITDKSVNDYIKYLELDETLKYGDFVAATNAVNEYVATCQNETLKSIVKSTYDKRMLLAPGVKGFAFELTDIDGKTFKLEDLAGGLVYIDFWATWCGPCRRELPSLIQLEKDYHGKKVHFVSISLDHDKAAWEKFVPANNLKGVQLHADGDWQSAVATNYQIAGVPTFFLLDGNGVIIAPNAPRPSDPSIRTLLDENLAKME